MNIANFNKDGQALPEDVQAEMRKALGGGMVAGTPVHAVAASKVIDFTGADNNVSISALVPGAAGNDISFALSISGSESDVISITVDDTDISVVAGSTTPASTLIAALLADESASALIFAQLDGDDDGTGVVSAKTKTNLEGGIDATEAKQFSEMVDEDYRYLAVREVTVSSTEGWVKSAITPV